MNLGRTTIVVLERITRKTHQEKTRNISDMLKYSHMHHTGICVFSVTFLFQLLEAWSGSREKIQKLLLLVTMINALNYT